MIWQPCSLEVSSTFLHLCQKKEEEVSSTFQLVKIQFCKSWSCWYWKLWTLDCRAAIVSQVWYVNYCSPWNLVNPYCLPLDFNLHNCCWGYTDCWVTSPQQIWIPNYWKHSNELIFNIYFLVFIFAVDNMGHGLVCIKSIPTWTTWSTCLKIQNNWWILAWARMKVI